MYSYQALVAAALAMVVYGAPQFPQGPAFPGAVGQYPGGPGAYYPGFQGNNYYNRAPGGFVPIVSQHYVLNPDQSYNFAYRSADGSARDEVGAPRVPGPEGPAVAVQGSYSYQSPAGPVQVSYIADENGFQPSGPSVHPDIVKAVAFQVAQARGGAPGGQFYNQNFPGAPGAYYNPGAYRRY